MHPCNETTPFITMETDAAEQRLTHGSSQTDSKDLLFACCKSCVSPLGDSAKLVSCDFCGVNFHILCVGLEKLPSKGAKTRWFCQPCLKLPSDLRTTKQLLIDAQQTIISLQAQLSELSRCGPPCNADTTSSTEPHTTSQTYSAKVSSYSPAKHSVAVVGDSMIRDLQNEDFANEIVNVNCIRGAVVKDVKNHIVNNVDTSSVAHIIIHVGTNDVAKESIKQEDILSDFEELITTTQVKCGSSTQIHISGPCPRGDQFSQSISDINTHLIDLTAKLDCRFINNLPSFSYGDGEIDSSLFLSDGLHLSLKGSKKLKQKYSTIGPVCLTHTAGSNPSLSRSEQYATASRVRHDRRDSRSFNHFDVPRYHKRSPLQHRHVTRREPPRFRGESHKQPVSHGMSPNTGYTKKYSRGCYNCGERNHTTQGCRYDVPIICRNCGLEGHKDKFCHH